LTIYFQLIYRLNLQIDIIETLFNFNYFSIFYKHYSSEALNLEFYQNIKNFSTLSKKFRIITSGEELSSNNRNLKTYNPIVGYSFKVGDFYPSNTITSHPSIFRSLSDITRGVRRAN
jgi:hypothetical protein